MIETKALKQYKDHLETLEVAFSGENYSLTPDEGSPYEKYKDILNSCFVLTRKDVNTLCGWIVTAPKELPEALERKFFEDTYDFLNHQPHGRRERDLCAGAQRRERTATPVLWLCAGHPRREPESRNRL